MVDIAEYTNELLWQFLSSDRYNPSNLAKRVLTNSRLSAKNDSEILLVSKSSSTNEAETPDELTREADTNHAVHSPIIRVCCPESNGSYSTVTN